MEIEDLMAAAIGQKPMEFENAFNSIIIDRVTDAIGDKKLEMANKIFNKSSKSEEDEENEEETK